MPRWGAVSSIEYQGKDQNTATGDHGLEFLLPETVVRDQTSQEGSYVLEPPEGLRELIVEMQKADP